MIRSLIRSRSAAGTIRSTVPHNFELVLGGPIFPLFSIGGQISSDFSPTDITTVRKAFTWTAAYCNILELRTPKRLLRSAINLAEKVHYPANLSLKVNLTEMRRKEVSVNKPSQPFWPLWSIGLSAINNLIYIDVGGSNRQLGQV